MGKIKPEMRVLSAQVHHEIYDHIKKIQKHRGGSLGDILRDAIMFYIENENWGNGSDPRDENELVLHHSTILHFRRLCRDITASRRHDGYMK
jgi:DNA phosphorothioation-dependent restriction protein DptG